MLYGCYCCCAIVFERYPIYFFPSLTSVFGNEKQRWFVSSYFWQNTGLTAFWGWFHSIHVEGMKEAHPGRFLLSWINRLMRILLPHCSGPVSVSEARYSFENISITYLLMSQPVIYLERDQIPPSWLRHCQKDYYCTIIPAILFVVNRKWSTSRKWITALMGSQSAFLALRLYKGFLKRPILTEAFHRGAQGQFVAIITMFVQKHIHWKFI